MRFLRFGEHSWSEDNLSAYVDRRLSSTDARRLETHIAGCERCRLNLAELQATVEAVRALPALRAPRSFALGPDWARRPALRPLPTRPAPAGFWRTGMGLQGGAIAAALLFVALIAADLVTVRQPASLDRSGRDELATMATAAATTMPLATGTALPKAGSTATPTEEMTQFQEAAPTTATGTPTAAPTASPTATSTLPAPAATASPAPTGTPAATGSPAPTGQATADAGTAAAPTTAEESPRVTVTETPADRTARLSEVTATPGPALESAESPDGAGGAPQAPDTVSDARADEDSDGRIGWRITQGLAAVAAAGLAFLAIRRRREQTRGS